MSHMYDMHVTGASSSAETDVMLALHLMSMDGWRLAWDSWMGGVDNAILANLEIMR